MTVKINANEIYKITQSCSCNEMEEIFEALPSDLQVFARYKVGAGFYQWILPGEGWICLSEADELDAVDVRKQLAEKKSAIRAQLLNNPKINIDNIFTTPGDEYVFFKIKDNCLDVKLAAWDYKFPTMGPGKSVVISGPKVPIKQKVVLVFIEAGQSAGERVFSYKTYSGRAKEAVTDENGRFSMGDLLVGKSYGIFVKGLAAPITLIPEKGKEEYIIDMTLPYRLNVRVLKDGSPVDNHHVMINYMGNLIELYTINGETSTELPYNDVSTCLVAIEDEQRRIQLLYPQTEVIFELETKYSNINLTINRNGRPVVGANFLISYDNQTYNIVSDINGHAHYSLAYLQGRNVSVTVEGKSQNQIIDPVSNTFTFNFYEDIKIKPHILVLNESGAYSPYYPLIVESNGVRSNVETNGSGICELPEMKVGQEIIVYDCKDLNNTATYTIQEEKEEYIFRVTSPIERRIEFAAQDDMGKPIANQIITLSQNGKEAVLHLNSEGKATLARDIFTFGDNITSSLNIDGVNKASFDIQLDEDEDEYVLQFSTKERKAWWKYLLEVLFILLLVFLILFFWFFINAMLA